jgi:hypothetical protein
MILGFIIIVLMFLGLVAQHFLGVFPMLGGEILLMPVVFFYAAAALPIYGMLTIALVAGIMWDSLTWMPVDGHVDMAFGSSVLIYGALGAIMNGLRPMFIRGGWPIHCLLTGILTSLLVLLEYVVITFRREPFALIWPKEVWHRILGSGVAALIIAPFAFLILNWFARRFGYFDRSRLLEETA